MEETGHRLLAYAVVGRAEKTAEIQVRAGQVSGNAATPLGGPSAGRQLDDAGRAVEKPTKMKRAGRIGVQVAADASLLVTGHSVNTVLARPAERGVCWKIKTFILNGFQRVN